jgi:hypothetical protein
MWLKSINMIHITNFFSICQKKLLVACLLFLGTWSHLFSMYDTNHMCLKINYIWLKFRILHAIRHVIHAKKKKKKKNN